MGIAKGWANERMARQIKRPTLSTQSKKLYYQGPPQLQEQTRPNLDRKLRELIASGEEVGVSWWLVEWSKSPILIGFPRLVSRIQGCPSVCG